MPSASSSSKAARQHRCWLAQVGRRSRKRFLVARDRGHEDSECDSHLRLVLRTSLRSGGSVCYHRQPLQAGLEGLHTSCLADLDSADYRPFGIVA